MSDIFLSISDVRKNDTCSRLSTLTNPYMFNLQSFSFSEAMFYGSAMHYALAEFFKLNKTITESKDKNFFDFSKFLYEKYIKFLKDNDKDYNINFEVNEKLEAIKFLFDDLVQQRIIESFLSLITIDKVELSDVEVEKSIAIPFYQKYQYSDDTIFLVGRLDLFGHTSKNEKVIVDYKTCSSMPTNVNYYELFDEQIIMYLFLLSKAFKTQVNKFEIVFINTADIKLPKMLKSGKLSTNKSQITTLTLLIQSLKKHNISISDKNYVELIESVRNRKYVQSHEIYKPTDEIKNVFKTSLKLKFRELHQNIRKFKEGKPNLIAKPSPMVCNFCQFKVLCNQINVYGTKSINKLLDKVVGVHYTLGEPRYNKNNIHYMCE